MRKAGKSILAAIAMASLPALAHAATVSYQFDLADFSVSSDGGNTFHAATVTGTAANPIVSLHPGDILFVGADANVTNNPNPAKGVGYDASHNNQPANLGILAFQVGLSDNNATAASVFNDGAGHSIASVNSNFGSLKSSGNLNNSGGIDSITGIAGSNIITGEAMTTSNSDVPKLSYGATTFAELFNSLAINANNTGTAVFSLTDNDTALQYPKNATTGSALVGPTYTNQTFIPGTDTLSALPTLTVNVAPVPEPASIGVLALSAVGLLARRRQNA